MSSFGTTAQAEYAGKLAKKAGFGTLEEAAASITGRPLVSFQVTPFTKDQASKVITALEARTGATKQDSKPSRSDSASESTDTKPRSKFLTARHLRLIATHQEVAPEQLDDDAAWVLSRLARLSAIEAFVRRGQPDQPLAVNEGAPIRVEQLVKYFGSEESAADAFAVSVKTLKDWGQHLPAAHSFRAEVLTNGYVQAPRN